MPKLVIPCLVGWALRRAAALAAAAVCAALSVQGTMAAPAAPPATVEQVILQAGSADGAVATDLGYVSIQVPRTMGAVSYVNVFAATPLNGWMPFWLVRNLRLLGDQGGPAAFAPIGLIVDLAPLGVTAGGPAIATAIRFDLVVSPIPLGELPAFKGEWETVLGQRLARIDPSGSSPPLGSALAGTASPRITDAMIAQAKENDGQFSVPIGDPRGPVTPMEGGYEARRCAELLGATTGARHRIEGRTGADDSYRFLLDDLGGYIGRGITEAIPDAARCARLVLAVVQGGGDMLLRNQVVALYLESYRRARRALGQGIGSPVPVVQATPGPPSDSPPGAAAGTASRPNPAQGTSAK